MGHRDIGQFERKLLWLRTSRPVKAAPETLVCRSVVSHAALAGVALGVLLGEQRSIYWFVNSVVIFACAFVYSIAITTWRVMSMLSMYVARPDQRARKRGYLSINGDEQWC